MILPPIVRDSPLEVETNESHRITSSFRRMLTKYFDNNDDDDDEMDFYKNGNTHDSYYPGASLLLASSSYYQGNNNLQYSLLAGIFQGLGTTASASSALKINPKTFLGRILIPGGLAFETHHALSHALYQGVFQEDKRSNQSGARKTSSPIGYFENVLNYELNIVSGATAGLVYSLANYSAATSRFSKATTATNMLGFAALFGGYDVYSDIFGSLLLLPQEQQQDGHQASATTIPTMAVIGLAGGCAGMTQACVIELRRSILAMRSSTTQLELVSETAGRYATAAAATTTSASSTSNMTSKHMMRAFVPGAAAFLVYERFGNMFSSSA